MSIIVAAKSWAGTISRATAAFVAMCPVWVLAQQAVATPTFDIVDIKLVPLDAPSIVVGPGSPGTVRPGGQLVSPRSTLRYLISLAYDLKNPAITLINCPDWGRAGVYDIQAKPADGFPNLTAAENLAQVRLMVQAMLADRFKLVAHRETRTLPVFHLVLASGGPKPAMKPAPDSEPRGIGSNTEMGNSGGRIIGKAMSMDSLANLLGGPFGRVVINETGLQDFYDINIQWQAAPLPDGAQPAPGLGPDGIALLSSQLTEQLGLRLVSKTDPVEVLVVDHVEKPAVN